MSLPVRQRRALGQIEKALSAEGRLRTHFAIFTRLTINEPMPGTEHIKGGFHNLVVVKLAVRSRSLRFVLAGLRRRQHRAAAPLKGPQFWW